MKKLASEAVCTYLTIAEKKKLVKAASAAKLTVSVYIKNLLNNHFEIIEKNSSRARGGKC